jgi:hypothetical protein
LSNNAALTRLICDNNNLTSLEVSNNAALYYLSCSANNLTSLDVSNNAALYSLDCQANNLSTDALNLLFASLPAISAEIHNSMAGDIYIQDNPGASTCNKTTAMAKGWNFKIN